MEREAPSGGNDRRRHWWQPRRAAEDLGALARNVWKDAREDRLGGLAAEVAFFVMLSLPPLLLVALGALGYVGEALGPDEVASLKAEILDLAATFLSASTLRDTVEPAVTDLLERGRADILSIGALIALWSGSRAIRVFVRAVTIAYGLEDRRTWWQHRVLAVALTAAGVLTLVVVLPLLVVGPRFGAALAGEFGLADAFDRAWSIAYWPVVFALGLTLLTWVYHIVPAWHTRWRRDLPGALFALGVWLIGSFGLRQYAVRFIETDSVYALFTAPFVLLLWAYVTAMALLAGAEVNAEIEKLWPTAGSPYLSAGQAGSRAGDLMS